MWPQAIFMTETSCWLQPIITARPWFVVMEWHCKFWVRACVKLCVWEKWRETDREKVSGCCIITHIKFSIPIFFLSTSFVSQSSINSHHSSGHGIHPEWVITKWPCAHTCVWFYTDTRNRSEGKLYKLEWMWLLYRHRRPELWAYTIHWKGEKLCNEKKLLEVQCLCIQLDKVGLQIKMTPGYFISFWRVFEIHWEF